VIKAVHIADHSFVLICISSFTGFTKQDKWNCHQYFSNSFGITNRFNWYIDR